MAITRAFDAAQNLWYQDVPGKGRVYDSPAAYGAAKPDIGGGALHKDPRWDQSQGKWDAGIDWGKIYTYAMPAIATLGASTALTGGGAVAGSGVGLGETAGGFGVGGLSATSLGLPATAGLGTAGAGAGVGGGMGWLDTAKKIYDGYSKAKGVYDTGRSIYGDLAGGTGAAAGGASAGRAQGRIDEAGIQQRQDQNMLERARLASLNTADLNRFTLDKSAADIAQRKFGLEAPGMRASNAVRGDILANAQDATIAPGTLGPNVHVPTISGGLRPSMFSDSTRQLGGLLSSQALAGQQAGDTFDPLTYQQPDPIPGLTPLPQSNGVDTFLNTAGVVGTGMDAFLQWLKRYQANKPPTSTPPFTMPGTTSGLLDPSTEGYGYTA